MKLTFKNIACTLLALPALAQAQLVVDIAGTGTGKIPVAIATFEGEGLLKGSFSEVIRADLERSGLFRLVETGPLPIGEGIAPDLVNWRQRGADAILQGTLGAGTAGAFEARYRLYDAVKQAQIEGLSRPVLADAWRNVAHRVADDVYEKLLGEPGVFSTRIAYVLKLGTISRLQIAYPDGVEPKTLLSSNQPIISPTWSPDGRKLAYVGFELRKPVVYIVDITSGQAPMVLANYRGSNSSPAWAPNGRELAVVLTKDGRSQIYIVNADGTGLRRLMTSTGIDTEPNFSPDGQWIYFTSDRGGAPQIYRVGVNGGEAQRVTFDGAYNVTPRISPDGRTLAYITRGPKGFQLVSMDLQSRQAIILTDSVKDETPSFSPNSRYIMYTTLVNNKNVLMAMTRDGRFKFRIEPITGDAREPAWGPFNR